MVTLAVFLVGVAVGYFLVGLSWQNIEEEVERQVGLRFYKPPKGQAHWTDPNYDKIVRQAFKVREDAKDALVRGVDVGASSTDPDLDRFLRIVRGEQQEGTEEDGT